MNQVKDLSSLNLLGSSTQQVCHLSRGQRELISRLEKELGTALGAEWEKTISAIPVFAELVGEKEMHRTQVADYIRSGGDLKSAALMLSLCAKNEELTETNALLIVKLNGVIYEMLLTDIKKQRRDTGGASGRQG